MKKPKLSPAEQSLLVAYNRAKSLWSFENIRTKGAILTKAFGVPSQDETPISFKEISQIYEDLLKQIKAEIPPEILPEIKEEEKKDTSAYNPKPPKQSAILHPKQAENAKFIFDNIVYNKKHGLQLIGATGVGKTFVMGSVFRNLLDINFFYERSVSPWPIVCITKATIVEKTKRELRKYFSIDCDLDEVKVINIDQLRATFGEMYIKDETIVSKGEAHTKYTWKKNIHPCIFWWDENQVLKNVGSQQSCIGQAVNDIPFVEDDKQGEIFQVFASATPWTTVSEAKCFAVATRKKISIGLNNNIILKNEYWPSYSKMIAAPADPLEHSPKAMENFVTLFDDYIITMRNVRPKFHALNQVQLINFRNAEEREFYDKTEERYIAKKAELEAIDGMPYVCMLALWNEFRMAAELLRAEHIADWFHLEIKSNKAPVAAVCFKETINKICWFLNKKYGYTRDQVSIIWGGNIKNKKLEAKAAKAKEVLANEELMAKFTAAGIDLETLGLDLSESESTKVNKSQAEKDFLKEFELGPQSLKQRQKDIDKFQYGKSLCCIFTFKAGGVGLSLHHEFTHTKQRSVILSPTYSAVELVQGLGRCPRITSLSDTSQTIVFYMGTIETHVAQRVSLKLKCLQKAVRNKESWESIVMGDKYHNKAQQLLKDMEEEDDDIVDVDVTLVEEKEVEHVNNYDILLEELL